MNSNNKSATIKIRTLNTRISIFKYTHSYVSSIAMNKFNSFIGNNLMYHKHLPDPIYTSHLIKIERN